jgi:hypothetical protein
MKAGIQTFGTSSDLLNMAHKRIVVDDVADAVMSLAKTRSSSAKPTKPTHKMMCLLQYNAAFQRPAKLNGLAGTKQFNSQDKFEIS